MESTDAPELLVTRRGLELVAQLLEYAHSLVLLMFSTADVEF